MDITHKRRRGKGGTLPAQVTKALVCTLHDKEKNLRGTLPAGTKVYGPVQAEIDGHDLGTTRRSTSSMNITRLKIDSLQWK